MLWKWNSAALDGNRPFYMMKNKLKYASVRAAGLRQRHIDQAQSMNLYITNDYSMRQVLRLYLEAWRAGVKTIYYVRSKALEVEACESCSS